MHKLRLWAIFALCAAFYALIIIGLDLPQISDFKNYIRVAQIYHQTGQIPELYMFFQAPLILFFVKISKVTVDNPGIWFAISVILTASVPVIFGVLHGIPEKWNQWLILVSLIFSPVIISLLPYVNTEVIMVPFFLGAHALLFLRIDRVSGAGLIMRWVLAGACFAVAQAIRPVAMYYMIFIFISAIIIYFWLRTFSLKKYLIPAFLCVTVFYFSTNVIYQYFGYGFRMQPRGDGYWNLYVGANSASKGVYNKPDAQRGVAIIDHFKGDHFTDHVRDSFKKMASERMKNNIGKNVLLIPYKTLKLLNPFYVSNFLYLNPKNPSHILLKAIFLLSSCMILLIYCANFITFIRVIFTRNINGLNAVFMVILLAVYAYTAIHVCLLEIQPRYYYHLSLIQIFMAPYSIKYLSEVINTRFRKLQ